MLVVPDVITASIYAFLLAILLARTQKSAITTQQIIKTSIWSSGLNCEASLGKESKKKREREEKQTEARTNTDTDPNLWTRSKTQLHTKG